MGSETSDVIRQPSSLTELKERAKLTQPAELTELLTLFAPSGAWQASRLRSSQEVLNSLNRETPGTH